ncbi:hypothetical protein [Microbacterium sp. GXF7504]
MTVQLTNLVTPTVASDALVGVIVALVLVGAVAGFGALFAMGREPFRRK